MSALELKAAIIHPLAFGWDAPLPMRRSAPNLSCAGGQELLA